MTKGNSGNRFSTEVRARAVRLVLENEADYRTRSECFRSISQKIGCSPETLRDWVNKQAVETGDREGLNQSERAQMKELQRENRELRQANEILRKASGFFRSGGPRPPTEEMIMFIDDHREHLGVEAICKVLPIAPSTYYRHKSIELDPEKASARAKRDMFIMTRINIYWEKSRKRYGAVKIWHDLLDEGTVVARCTVVRLMKSMGIKGVTRGDVTTTKSNPALPCPEDKVNRKFKAPAPNILWVADFTYVRTAVGFVYVAFIIDVFARYIVGWKVSSSPNAQMVLDALDQALAARQPDPKSLIHHSDRGVQYLSIKYTDRLEEAKIDPSVGSVGDSYDNAMAETINGLYKAEVIEHEGPWQGKKDVEFATLDWVHWFNTERRFGPIGYIAPAQAERNFYDSLNTATLAAA
ncbi:IS3 family transposase [Ralstonia pseudosolanacearum]|uniref:IS3 family transposase n=1 Tax=Ralstonia pseudosolanacearum TaxID=1310165 RepID=UPI003CEDA157